MSTKGTTCTSSSEISGYSCYGAINRLYGTGRGVEWVSNGEGVGAWLQLTLPQTYSIVRMKVVTRATAANDQARDVQINFTSPLIVSQSLVNISG